MDSVPLPHYPLDKIWEMTEKKTLYMLFSRGSMDNWNLNALLYFLDSGGAMFDINLYLKIWWISGCYPTAPLPIWTKLGKWQKKTLYMLFSRGSVDNWNLNALLYFLDSGGAMFDMNLYQKMWWISGFQPTTPLPIWTKLGKWQKKNTIYVIFKGISG